MTVGFCGIECEKCKVYEATMMPMGEARLLLQEEMAAKWREDFKYDFEAEHMVCHGCQSEDLCGYCKSCEIRACGREKSISTCEMCHEFPCEKVSALRHSINMKQSNHVFAF